MVSVSLFSFTFTTTKSGKRSLRTSNFRGKNKNNTSILHKYIVGILDKLTKSISINYYWNFELKFKTIFKKAFPFYILIDFDYFPSNLEFSIIKSNESGRKSLLLVNEDTRHEVYINQLLEAKEMII